MFFLIIYLFCFVSNFIIVSQRQQSNVVYNMLKQIELFTFAKIAEISIADLKNVDKTID